MHMYLIDISQFALKTPGTAVLYNFNKTYKPLNFNSYELTIRRCSPKL